jgi:hypothetical protein
MATPNSVAIEILQELEKATDDAGFVARVEKRVNDALDEIAITTNYNMFKTRSTFNTVAGTAVYQLPAGGREIEQLRYTDNGQPIWLWGTQEAARQGAMLENDGRASVWIEDGVLVSGSNTLYQFRLGPVPNSVLEIEQTFYYHPSEIATADPIPIQDQYLPLVRRFVKASIYRLDNKYDAAQIEQVAYDKLLDGLVKQEKRKVAKSTRMRASDVRRDGGRPQAVFPLDHFENQFL